MEYGKRILIHYFRLALESAGKKWDRDCEVEISEAVEDIVNSIVSKVREEERAEK